MPQDLSLAVQTLVTPLRDRMEASGLSQAQLARTLCWDRSRVSRALSGRETPSRQLIEGIAEMLGADVDETRQQWLEADRIRRRARTDRVTRTERAAIGGPPDDLVSYADLLRALGDLVRGSGLSQRQVVLRDHSCTLRRSTVGAVLRGQRSASRDVVIAIVRACGVDDDSCVAAWEAAWQRFGRPHRDEQHHRQVTGYRQRQYMQATSHWEARRWR
jgi:transcriptional regulator with XRE-family HTH domain